VETPQALLVVSFGGPESPEEILPFLRRVVAGRGVPDSRLAGVAEHYHHLGGRSPINDQCRALIAALRDVVDLPIYWGNLNWPPELVDAVAQMADDGIERAVAFVTSGFGSPPGCKRYRDATAAAQSSVGPRAPTIDKLPLFGTERGFVDAMAARVGDALARLPSGRLVFSTHSIPTAMAGRCPYLAQLRTSAAAIASAVGRDDWDLVFQSRSGPPSMPWLEPDVCDRIAALGAEGHEGVVVVPIGFVSDHVEVLWDLDVEAAQAAEAAGMAFARAGTVDTHPAFLRLIADQVHAGLPLPRGCGEHCCGAG